MHPIVQFIKFGEFQESKIQFEIFTLFELFFYLLLFFPETSLTMAAVCWISRRKKKRKRFRV